MKLIHRPWTGSVIFRSVDSTWRWGGRANKFLFSRYRTLFLHSLPFSLVLFLLTIFFTHVSWLFLFLKIRFSNLQRDKNFRFQISQLMIEGRVLRDSMIVNFFRSIEIYTNSAKRIIDINKINKYNVIIL